jgi:hypothetical protein
MAGKRAKNLLLDIRALNRGEEYCTAHGTTLSRLVEDFLLALPESSAWSRPSEIKSPIVRRLKGATNSGAFHGPDAYGDYLYRRSRGEPVEEFLPRIIEES